MSGVAEAITVIACVAALVSAYKDGSTIVQKIKERRQRRTGLPPTVHLENELKAGAADIQSAAEDGLQRYGTAFERGDDTAISALQAATIEIQRSIITNLREALEDDNVNDFSVCYDAAYTSRLRVVEELGRLQMRQHEARRAMKQPVDVEESAPRTKPASSPDSRKPLPAESKSPSKSPRPFSILPSIFRTKSGDDGNEAIASQPQQNNQKPKSPQQVYTTADADVSMSPPRPGTWEGSEGWTHTTGDERKTSAVEDDPASPENPPSPSILSSVDSSAEFCEGAYYLQASFDDGLKLSNQSRSFGGESYYWSCRNPKCAYEATAILVDGKWQLHDKIRELPGLRVRPRFLAKSHVEQRRVKKGIRHYRCLVCALTETDIKLISGASALLKHILQHTGDTISGVQLIGPVRFGKEMLVSCQDSNFDISFDVQDSERSTLSPVSTITTSDPGSNDTFPDDAQSIFEGGWRATE